MDGRKHPYDRGVGVRAGRLLQRLRLVRSTGAQGLRYLAHRDFALVRQSLRERERLFR